MKINSNFKLSGSFTLKFFVLLLVHSLAKVTFANDFECLKNSDCIKVETVCNGVIAINKKHIQKFKDLKTKLDADSLCDRVDESEIDKNKNLNAFCENKKCVLKSSLAQEN